MESDVAERLNEIGNILAQDTAYPLDRTFLYVGSDWGWVDMSIYKDFGDHLLWRDPDDDLSDALLELWEAAKPDKRWYTMQYHIADGKFDASFTYEVLDPKVSSMERREVVLNQRYGNKRIVYPPVDPGFLPKGD